MRQRTISERRARHSRAGAKMAVEAIYRPSYPRMDSVTIGLIFLGLLTALLFTGMRIAFATALCGFIGLWVLRGYSPAASLASNIAHGHLVSHSLLVLPLFIMMGYLAYFAGITRDLYWAARQWFGQLPGGLAMDVNPTVVLVCILALYLVLGMFLDGIGMLLLTVPVVLPVIEELGIHPIVFGVLVVRMIEIGLITPPVGLNVYVLRGVAPQVSMGDMFRGCGWFVFVDLINVAILIAFPSIILLIPETMIPP